MEQNQRLRHKSSMESQLANYMSVLSGLKHRNTHGNLSTQTSVALSPKKQGISEIAMNKIALMNSEE